MMKKLCQSSGGGEVAYFSLIELGRPLTIKLAVGVRVDGDIKGWELEYSLNW